jgi:hypothetical protein
MKLLGGLMGGWESEGGKGQGRRLIPEGKARSFGQLGQGRET